MIEINCDSISQKAPIAVPQLKLLFSSVLCNGCQTSIIKTRYRCTICRDFNLCLDCHQGEIFPKVSVNQQIVKYILATDLEARMLQNVAKPLNRRFQTIFQESSRDEFYQSSLLSLQYIRT